jgi:hypothetical protein
MPTAGTSRCSEIPLFSHSKIDSLSNKTAALALIDVELRCVTLDAIINSRVRHLACSGSADWRIVPGQNQDLHRPNGRLPSGPAPAILNFFRTSAQSGLVTKIHLAAARLWRQPNSIVDIAGAEPNHA